MNGGRERVFRPNPSHFSNYYLSSLNRGGERVFVSILHLFSNCCLSSFFLLTKSACVLRRFLGEKKGRARERRKLINPAGFINPGSLIDRLPHKDSAQADSTQLMGRPKYLSDRAEE